MNYYLDAEFHEYFVKPMFGKPRHTVSLISIGLVSHLGRTYYAVSKDFDIKAAWKNEWLRENVLKNIFKELQSKLSGQTKSFFPWLDGPFSYRILKQLINFYGKTNKEIAEEIIGFIRDEKLPERKFYPDMDNVEFALMADKYITPSFYGYYSDYDWVVFCSLFGRMIDLPKGFPMFCIDLKQMLDERLNDIWLRNNQSIAAEYLDKLRSYNSLEARLTWLKTFCPDYPTLQNEHNALADAEWNLRLHKFILTL